MTAKHTPGPWAVREITGSGYPGQIGYAIDYNTDQEQILDFVYEGADAYLIAAAPELLAVAESVMEWWETEQFRMRGDRNVWDGDAEPEQVTKARAALAKAKHP